MKSAILAAGGLLLALAGGAHAETLFRGHAVITGATAACVDFEVGQQSQSRYHPAIPGNDNFGGITFLTSHGGHGYTVDGPFTTSYKPASGGGLGWSNYDWAGSQVRILVQSPATIATSTRYVTLRGQIRKPRNDDGGLSCTITFEGAYTREPA